MGNSSMYKITKLIIIINHKSHID